VASFERAAYAAGWRDEMCIPKGRFCTCAWRPALHLRNAVAFERLARLVHSTQR
jgi:hypothetical protein